MTNTYIWGCYHTITITQYMYLEGPLPLYIWVSISGMNRIIIDKHISLSTRVYHSNYSYLDAEHEKVNCLATDLACYGCHQTCHSTNEIMNDGTQLYAQNP